MVVPWNNLGPFLLKANDVLGGIFKPCFLGRNHFLQRINVFQTLCDRNFCI
jgi:hypothetical protein